MREITYLAAINEELREAMAEDPRVFLMGEDIGAHGGAFGVTRGLWEAFGAARVLDTPISENTLAGAALGAALTGMRPVLEFMFADFSRLALDQILNEWAKVRYMYGGQCTAPVVLRTPQGGLSWKSAAAHHAQSLEALFVHIPGLKVVLPSTPYDAKGLLKAAIQDDSPVIFLEHKAMYADKGPVPEEAYLVPLGQADLKRAGEDVTIVAAGKMCHYALEAAEALAAEGIDAEVIDPRTLKPLDEAAIFASVRKTHRAVLVQEAPRTGGVAADWGMRIMEACFDWLDAPIVRLAGADVPIPYANSLEAQVWPRPADIAEAVRRLVALEI
ncbi:MAG: alpha-ketoacid dehydrogenase subunit beta [Anaerolineae bacterium]|nr:alpha-ketoacid dehydrogenase subunit beta [Anaerolineae bacterium]